MKLPIIARLRFTAEERSRGRSPEGLTHRANLQQVVEKLDETSPQVKEDQHKRLFSIPWGHHIVLLTKFSNHPEIAWFYVNQTIENGWRRAILLTHIITTPDNQPSFILRPEKSPFLKPEYNRFLDKKILKNTFWVERSITTHLEKIIADIQRFSDHDHPKS